MSIKKLKWDDCNMRGITGRKVPFSAIDAPVEIGMKVSAKYKGKSLHMKIITEISPSVFEAAIFDIESSRANYEDISIDDRVEIPREFICHIFPTK